MKKLLLLCLSVLTASCDTATRQFESRLDEILSGHKAFVGVAVRTPGGETIARNDTLLPMMSVFKFPVALAVLDRMQREGNTWKIIDVNVGGVWMVQNYHSQFASVLANGGIPALIRSMNDKTSSLNQKAKK